MTLRQQSLIAILENHNFMRKSLNGLRNDLPDLYLKLKDFYQEKEAYQMLELMVNQEDEMDRKYMIWVQTGCLPHIFEIKEIYSEIEYSIFSLKTKVPLETFNEIVIATAS